MWSAEYKYFKPSMQKLSICFTVQQSILPLYSTILFAHDVYGHFHIKASTILIIKKRKALPPKKKPSSQNQDDLVSALIGDITGFFLNRYNF